MLDLLSSIPSQRPGQHSAANAWTWPRFGRPSTWMEGGNLYLPAGTSAVQGRLSFAARPYWRKVVDACVEPKRKQIVVLSGSQTGKSLGIGGLTAFGARSRAGSIMWMRENEASAKGYFRSHLRKIYLASPALRAVMSTSRSDLRGDGIDFPNGARIILAHAGSKTGAQSKDPWLAIVDEYDKCADQNEKEGDLASRILQRVLTHRSLGRCYYVSTPTEENFGVWALWEQWRQEVWSVRCSECDGLFPLEFEYETPANEADRIGGVRWPRLEDGTHPDPSRLRSSGAAWWECPCCAERVFDADKARLVQGGEYKLLTPDRDLQESGFRISGLASPDITWTDAAARFLASLNRPASMTQFRREVLTLPREIRSKIVGARLEDLRTSWRSANATGAPGPTNLPPLPRGIERVYFAADAQKVEFWGVLLGIGFEGRAWLLWAGRIDSKDDIRKIDLASWEREDGQRLWLSMGGIDGNDGNRTEELAHLVSTLTNFRLLRGSRSSKQPIVAGSRDFKDPVTGKVVDTSIPFITWNTTHYQDVLQNSLDLGPADGPRCFQVPDDTPRVWFEHIRGEVRRERIVDGFPRMVWEPVTRSTPQHLRDANCMAYVVADLDGWLYHDHLPELDEADMREAMAAMGM